LCVSNEEIGKYGKGVFLYINFLKKTAIVFFLMSCMAAIPLAINYRAGGVIINL